MSIDPTEAAQEIAYESFLEELKQDKAFIDEAFEEVSSENIQSYLGKYGDVIENKVKESLHQAEELHRLGFFGSSLVLSATAIEIIIRFFLIRPLVQGAFLSDEWSKILLERIATGRTADDRRLLPGILRQWGIDITSIKLPSGKDLWASFLNIVRKKRDDFVYKGAPVTALEATLGIECTNVFLEQVVRQIASKLGFTIETTGKWCKIYRKYAFKKIEKSFTPEDPF